MADNALVFIDTSYFVALLNRKDRFHARATELARRWAAAATDLFTIDEVLVELANFHCRSPLRTIAIETIRRLRTNATWRIVPTSRGLLDRGEIRYATHADKHWSLTDCMSMEAMLNAGAVEAATTDRHFVQAGFRILMADE